MRYTYDLNGGSSSCLIITANSGDKKSIWEIVAEHGMSSRAEGEALDSMLCNSDLGWIQPEEIGALTDAPILGLRDDKGEVTAAWAFMDYQVRSFLTDLLETGKAVFISGN